MNEFSVAIAVVLVSTSIMIAMLVLHYMMRYAAISRKWMDIAVDFEKVSKQQEITIRNLSKQLEESRELCFALEKRADTFKKKLDDEDRLFKSFLSYDGGGLDS